MATAERDWRRVFIFIGGIQPKKTQVDDNPRTCPVCGLPSARLKRVDHYLSLFFIPLIPIKRGESFLECGRCQGVFEYPSPAGETPARQDRPRRKPSLCPACGKRLDRDFNFCPYCGQRI